MLELGVEDKLIDALPSTHISPEKLRVGDHTLEVIDLNPEVLKDKVPVLIAPGWSEGNKTFQSTLNIIAKSGRRAITFDYPRFGPDPKSDSYPKDQYRKAKTLIEIIETKGIEKVDVITHSDGAMAAAIAALEAPNKFRSLIFVSPVGLIGKDNFLRLLERDLGMLNENDRRMEREEAVESGLQTYFLEGVRYVIKNPIRALREAFSDSKANLRPLLTQLKSLGIKVAVIHGVDDPLFPMSRVQENTKSDDVAGFYSVKGHHNELHLQPDKYIPLALQALDDLNKAA